MANYVIYTRTDAGHVERVKDLSSRYPSHLLHRYFYKELLVGFPEEIVFWVNPDGPSMGIAPLGAGNKKPTGLGVG